jgi:hypothetical protein
MAGFERFLPDTFVRIDDTDVINSAGDYAAEPNDFAPEVSDYTTDIDTDGLAG